MKRVVIAACVAAMCCLSGCAAQGDVSGIREVDSVPAPFTVTPDTYWAWWYGEYGTPDLPSEFSEIPPCSMEDGSTPDGYEPVCYWDAEERGNGDGTSYVLVDGAPVIDWRAS